MTKNSKRYIILSILAVIMCTIAAVWKCNTIYGITRVEHLHCSVITIMGTIGAFYLLMKIPLHSLSLKIIQTLAPCVMMVYLIHRIILFHTTIAEGALWYNLLLFWLMSFAFSFVLNKVSFIRNYFKL